MFLFYLLALIGICAVLQDKTSKRRDDLDDSLQAQQYFADANESESWMREKEPIVGNTDYGKDEDSAEVKNIRNTKHYITLFCFSYIFRLFI